MGSSRTQFLRGDFGGRRRPIRPPWSIAEADFIRVCTRCDACSQACPQSILSSGRGGYPQVDFRRAECSFCGACVRVCAPQALSPEVQPAWAIRAAVQPGCVCAQGVVCGSCVDACAPRAIRMVVDRRGIGRPVIDSALCNGCGGCIAVCPPAAITAAEPAANDEESG
jgi:ferredoxin-type protein NapF